MVENYRELIDLIACRDGISRQEAYEAVENCRAEIQEMVSNGTTYDEVEEVLRCELGLEPDYLEVIL